MRRALIEAGPELFKAAQTGIVVTGSESHRRELQLAFQQHQTALDITTWRTPNIVPYHHWLTDLYRDLQERGYSAAQKTLISDEALRLAITQSVPDREVLKHASELEGAWNIAWNWDLWPVWHDVTSTENGELCKQWIDRLRNLLDEQELITRPELEHMLIRAIEDGVIQIPNVTLHHIFEPYRMQLRLFDAIRSTKSEVSPDQQETTLNPHGALVAFSTPSEELNAMGVWARMKLNSLGDGARIGIVSGGSSPEELRRQFERSFPEVNDIGQVIHLHSNRTLGSTNQWHELDTFLRWTKGALHFSELKPLHNSQTFSRLAIPRTFSKNWPEYISLSRYASQAKNNTVRTFLRKFPILSRRGLRHNTSFARHIETLIEILRDCGWKEAAENTFTHLIQSRIADALSNMSVNSGFLENSSWSEFVDFLRHVGPSTPLVDTNPVAPIQIVSISQSRGLKFDALWVSGLANTKWPSRVRPNALLPLHMQKEAQIRRTTPQDQLRFSIEMMNAWYGSSSDLMFSYSKEEEDSETVHSALIQSEPTSIESVLAKHAYMVTQHHPWELDQPSLEMENYTNNKGSQLVVGDQKRQRTSMLNNQANCPFKAFFVNRLRVEIEKDEPSTFPGYTGRGHHFHDAIESITNEHKTKAEIRSVIQDDARLDAYLEEVLARKRYNLPEAFAYQEKQILKQMLRTWDEEVLEVMEEEFRILGTELRREIKIGPFEFEPRIDKIQAIGPSHVEIIDYKTGQVSPTKWSLAGLEPWLRKEVDTQMPLYSQLLLQEDPEFGPIEDFGYEVINTQVDKSESGIQTRRYLASEIDDVQTEFGGNLSEFVQRWAGALKDLTENYLSGEATVTPKVSVCRYCTLQNLCRKFEIEGGQ